MKTVANVNGVKLEFVTRREGTEDCEVHFRLPRNLYLAFLKFYGKKHNCFRTFELYGQGSGWYAAFSDNFVRDGAIRVRRLVHRAMEAVTRGFFSITQWKESLRSKNQVLTKDMSGLSHIVKKIVKCGKTKVITICRKLQAAEARATKRMSLIDEAIKEELSLLVKKTVSQDRIQGLKLKFCTS